MNTATMSDPYARLAASADRGSFGRASFPGFLQEGSSPLAAQHIYGSGLQDASSSYRPKDFGAYGVNDINGVGVHREPIVGGLTPRSSMQGYLLPQEDPSTIYGTRGVAYGVSPSIPDIATDKTNPLRSVEGLSVGGESNVLFVDGLPSDCTRREVGHLFRPFIGFKELRVVHKEPRRTGDKAIVLCFVEFTDAKCALTAMEALQGYRFDDKKPDSPMLRIQYAHFPFRHDELRVGG